MLQTKEAKYLLYLNYHHHHLQSHQESVRLCGLLFARNPESILLQSFATKWHYNLLGSLLHNIGFRPKK